MSIAIADVESWVHRLYIGVEGTSLRKEDLKKSRELVGILGELGLVIDRIARGRDPITIVDAAAGKAYASLLALPLVLAPRARRAVIRAIERDPARAESIRTAAARVSLDGGSGALASIDVIIGDVGDEAVWPTEPDVVIALHACGDASDRVIARATGARARWILVAPCCVAGELASARRADARATAMAVPRSGDLRRGMIESLVMAERMLELESRGWRTELVPFTAPTVTPHRHLLRAERIADPTRMSQASQHLSILMGTGSPL